MARIRTIKPDFFISDTVSALPLRARLTWIGLWTHCDDYGRCRDNVKLIKAAVWPLDDVSLRDIESDLDELEQANVVYRYIVGAKGYIQVTNWSEHQKVDHPSKVAFPAPDEGTPKPRDELASTRDDFANPRAGREREGKGGEGTRADAREPHPPRTCPKHEDDPNPPACGLCADARRYREKWDQEQAEREAMQRQTAAADQSRRATARAEATRAEIDACRLCDATGYTTSGLCRHDPMAADRARNGAARVAAALKGEDP